MPKIDPSQLLGCLDSLLGADGGIKGETEVKRLAVLMTKFSKKLVSKCIYILILKNTEPDLLAKFMAEGGWALVFQWLDEGICNNNYPLIQEILELLLKCPISLDRLKENNCPKVVKGLSKDSECEEVKKLAGKIVERWLKFIKSGQAAISDVAMAAVATPAVSTPGITVLPSNITVVPAIPLNSSSSPEVKKTAVPRSLSSKPGIQYVQSTPSGDEEESEAEGVVPSIGSLPLYKITVRDGKSVLAKVGTKTLTIPVKKVTDSEVESNTVTSVVLKSDSITKKIRYVTKPVSEKEKSDASDDKNVQKSISISSEGLSKSKVASSEKTNNKKVEENKTDRVSDGKVKQVNVKSEKDGSKGKDGQNKISKSERDSDKSESKHKDREKRSSRDSEKDKRRSEHKSHKTDKTRDKDRDRDRDREKDKIKSRDRDSSKEKRKDSDKDKIKDKHNKEKESKETKSTDKLLSAAEKAQIQADKDKDTLERLKTPAISLLGKIPKKSSSQNLSNSEKSTSSNSSYNSSSPVHGSLDRSNPVNKSADSSEESSGDKKVSDLRNRKERPKTVKTFNSKFRSTGLEEEIKPPPPRSSLKKKLDEKRPLSLPQKPDAAVRSSSSKGSVPPEKKLKLADLALDVKKDKVLEKAGGIKLIPPKPKPALLESDMFSDALTASTRMEPRKRKRRTSGSKEATEPKKEAKEENSVASSPEVTSPKDVKPALKFYRDTLEDDEEKNKENCSEIKTESKAESDSEDSTRQSSSGENQDGGKPVSKLYPNGVLVVKSKRRPKKSVQWKDDSELTSVRLFELDETERVNVTRTFVDMKLMERSHEREAFQLARKLASEDVMEERVPWGPLYEVDVPADRRPSVEPGKSSLEKDVQYAREKTVLQAIYFHRGLIPDSPAEPDPENHPTTDPKIIPLDDITGSSESVNNFQNIPWPEPKPALVPLSPPSTQPVGPFTHPHQQGPHPQPFSAGYSTVGNFPGYPQMGMPGMMPPGQGNWRPGDGKDMGMNVPFQPNGPLCPQMGQPPNLFNPGGPENFAMNGPPMSGFNPGFPMPCDPSMYVPPMGPMGMGGPPPGQWNRGGGGGGGGWQGGRPFMPPNNLQKFPKGVCHHFAKFGNCARGTSCRFMHPN